MSKDKDNYVDLVEIPLKNGKRDWKNSVGSTVKFKYEEVYGEFKIIEFLKNRYLLVTYENKEHKIMSSHLAECKIGRVISYRNYGWNYNIGDIVETATGKIKLTGKFTNDYRVKCYNYECLTCGHTSSKEQRDINNSCPSCINQVVTIGFNDMWTTNKGLASKLLNSDDGYKYVEGSNILLDWVCPDCKNIIYSRSPAYMKYNDFPCGHCSKSKSYPNKFFYYLLKSFKIEFVDEAIFDWSDLKRYDFYIPSLNLIIEAHGSNHYENCFAYLGGKTSEEEKKNDKYKEKLAFSNGIDKYVQIDCRKSTMNWIRNSIINSELSKYIDLSNVNWLMIHKLASRNYVKEICTLWNNGLYDLYEIAKKVDLKYGTVNKHLNNLHDAGLVNYDKTKTRDIGNKKAKSKIHNRYYKPIKCVETNQIFAGICICEQYSEDLFGNRITQSLICSVLKGYHKSTFGLHFQYITREEFNQIKSNPLTSHLAYGDFFNIQNSDT